MPEKKKRKMRDTMKHTDDEDASSDDDSKVNTTAQPTVSDEEGEDEGDFEKITVNDQLAFLDHADYNVQSQEDTQATNTTLLFKKFKTPQANSEVFC